MQHRNIFAGPYLDRAAHLRQDPAWFAAALADKRSRAIPVWNLRNLIAEDDPPRAMYLDLTQIEPERRNSEDLILLGRLGDTNYFAFDIDSIMLYQFDASLFTDHKATPENYALSKEDKVFIRTMYP